MKAQLGLAGLAIGVLLTAGCSQNPESVKPNAPGPAAAGVSADDLNAYHPQDAKFYRPMQMKMAGALLVRPPGTVKAATEKATVVVAARVGDIVAQRVISNAQTVGVLLTDVEVLHGQLEPSLAGKVKVELFLGAPANVAEQIDSFRAALPKGYSIWFLRWQGDKQPITKPGADPAEDPADPTLYSVVHRHAMFTQGPDSVINAIAEHGSDGRALPGLQAEVEKLSKLSELADQVRAS